MLEVIYNDNFTQLTLINNLNEEQLTIIDDNFKVYESITYGAFEPSINEMLTLWNKALKKYFRGCNKEYKEATSKRSLLGFEERLKKIY